MSFRKPFRICNDLKFKPLTLIQQQRNYAFLSVLKDGEEAYQLNIYVPYARRVDFSVYIQDHILNICSYETGIHTAKDAEHSLRIFLPLDVKEEMVTARIQHYGLKILMPKVPAEKNGKRIEIPVLGDN